jgi:hypothetical protein
MHPVDVKEAGSDDPFVIFAYKYFVNFKFVAIKKLLVGKTLKRESNICDDKQYWDYSCVGHQGLSFGLVMTVLNNYFSLTSLITSSYIFWLSCVRASKFISNWGIRSTSVLIRPSG